MNSALSNALLLVALQLWSSIMEAPWHAIGGSCNWYGPASPVCMIHISAGLQHLQPSRPPPMMAAFTLQRPTTFASKLRGRADISVISRMFTCPSTISSLDPLGSTMVARPLNTSRKQPYMACMSSRGSLACKCMLAFNGRSDCPVPSPQSPVPSPQNI